MLTLEEQKDAIAKRNWDAVILPLIPKAEALARSLGLNEGVQGMAYMELRRLIQDFDNRTLFWNYAYQFLKANIVRELISARSAREAASGEEETGSTAQGPFNVLEFNRICEGLEHQERWFLDLYYIHGFTIRDVAIAMNVPIEDAKDLNLSVIQKISRPLSRVQPQPAA